MTGNARAARLAWAVGLVALIGLSSLGLFFSRGAPFGAIHDACLALAALGCAGLAWLLRLPLYEQSPRAAWFGVGAALAGAPVAALGSILALAGAAGAFRAGLFAAAGYGLIGVWAALFARLAAPALGWSGAFRWLGLITGEIMAVGLLAAPALLGGLERQEAAPWYVTLSLLGGVGYSVLLPFWCFWLGRLLQQSAAEAPAAPPLESEPAE